MLFAAIALFLLAFLASWAAIYAVLPPFWRTAQAGFSALARAILRRERFAVWYERGTTRLRPLHPYRPLLYVMGIGFVTAALTGVAFLEVAERMQARHPRLEQVDHTVWRGTHRFRDPGPTSFFVALTCL